MFIPLPCGGSGLLPTCLGYNVGQPACLVQHRLELHLTFLFSRPRSEQLYQAAGCLPRDKGKLSLCPVATSCHCLTWIWMQRRPMGLPVPVQARIGLLQPNSELLNCTAQLQWVGFAYFKKPTLLP